MALTAAWESRGAEQEGGGGGVELSRSGNGEERIRREHMFDKVVTPSDVGKLNRLVVPKQFAERHILPRLLGGAARAACPGAVLRFEDGRGGGRAWVFRFSYWGSSQSYVMTKGWSAFVRDRRLAAGDTVSFCHAGARLFIDCRRRGTGIAASSPPTRLLVPAAGPAVVPHAVTLMPQRSTSSDDTVSFCHAGARLFIDCRRRGAGIATSSPPTRLLVPAAGPAVVPHVVTLMPQRSTSSDERAPPSRCVRLFGVDLKLAGAEPLPLDLQLALM